MLRQWPASSAEHYPGFDSKVHTGALSCVRYDRIILTFDIKEPNSLTYGEFLALA